MKRRGISTVIGTVIMIALVIVIVGIVWVSINTLVNSQIQSSESCFGNFGKVQIEKRYTCYNQSSNEFQFSVSVGDIKVDSVLVSLASSSGTKSINIGNSTVSNVRMFNGNYGETVVAPEKNAGYTYVVNVTGFGIGIPDSVSIAPVINDNQCEISDSLNDVGVC